MWPCFSAKSLLAFNLLAILSPFVSADFHILSTEGSIKEGGNRDHTAGRILVASNHYNCDGFDNAHDEGDGTQGDVGSAKDPVDWMAFKQGVCGSGKLDFWFRKESYTYDYYISDGDGVKLGTCYRNDDAPTKYCYSLFYSSV